MPPLPQYVFMAWCLVKHRDNFTFIYMRLGVGGRKNPYLCQESELLSSRPWVSRTEGLENVDVMIVT
jgi:hypothetical protein